ncbi:MAG: SEC-C metal-binding domain-containing protein [Nitrospirota bacterium]
MPEEKYYSDSEMIKLLKGAGAKLTLPEIYGLLYGCHAAPHMFRPSQLISTIFGKNEEAFASMEKTEQVIGNLLFLWNALGGWKPESEPLFYPDIEYPDTTEGLMERVKDDLTIIKSFIKGLDLGETAKTDFSSNAVDALKSLSEADGNLTKLLEVFQKQGSTEEEEFNKAKDSIVGLEGVIGVCIGRINLGLKDTRMRVVKEMQKAAESQKKTAETKSAKVQRNELCSCGSGKKYKKCCGAEQG